MTPDPALVERARGLASAWLAQGGGLSPMSNAPPGWRAP